MTYVTDVTGEHIDYSGYVTDVTGEHIDYSGYAVLPMAIEQDIVIAAAADPSSMQLQLTNTNTEYQ